MQSSGTSVVVVHGGGPQIADLLERLGRPSAFHEGLRVTDDATMDVVAMALGLVNARVVASLAHAGLDVVGLTGADRTLMTSTSLGEPWDRAGGPPRVRAAVIEESWALGVTPVVSSVATDAAGRLLNVNADAAAGALAAALGADALILLSDVDQVRRDPDDPESSVAVLEQADVRDMVESGRAREGMRPKLLAALDALDGGARVVTLANGTRPHALSGALDGSLATTEVRV